MIRRQLLSVIFLLKFYKYSLNWSTHMRTAVNKINHLLTRWKITKLLSKSLERIDDVLFLFEMARSKRSWHVSYGLRVLKKKNFAGLVSRKWTQSISALSDRSLHFLLLYISAWVKQFCVVFTEQLTEVWKRYWCLHEFEIGTMQALIMKCKTLVLIDWYFL